MSDATSVENGTRKITILGVPAQYVERYRVNGSQIERRNPADNSWSTPDDLAQCVAVINQTVSQNMGNNLRGDVKDLLATHNVTDGSQLPPDVYKVVQVQVQEMVDEEFAEYKFGGTRGPRGPRDPVKKLTMNYLLNKVRASATARGIMNWSDANVTEKAETLYKANPDKWRAEAEAAAKAAAKKHDDEFDAVMAA